MRPLVKQSVVVTNRFCVTAGKPRCINRVVLPLCVAVVRQRDPGFTGYVSVNHIEFSRTNAKEGGGASKSLAGVATVDWIIVSDWHSVAIYNGR